MTQQQKDGARVEAEIMADTRKVIPRRAKSTTLGLRPHGTQLSRKIPFSKELHVMATILFLM